MANKKSVGHAYNIDFLNVVFAASSLFLFFTTIWMVFDDFDREWKGYQRQFVLLEGYVTSLSLQAAQAGIDPVRLQQLNAERAAAEGQLAANAEQVAQLEDALADVEADYYLANQEFNFQKADYDVARYAYEELREEHPEEAEEERPEIDAMYDRWVELGLQVEELVARRDDLRAQIGEYTGGVSDADNAIRELTAEATRLAALVEDLQVDFVGDYLLNAPLLDFMAPSLTVQQTITPNVHDELNFIRFQKMDRCRTCHIAIDREGYEAYPQPYTTHPNLDTYVGSASPHPLATTGCTVCHEGMGQSIGFIHASHTPGDEAQMHAWEEQYGWEVPHLWDYPMLPTDMTAASCATCHQEPVYVDAPQDLPLAYSLYQRPPCPASGTTRTPAVRRTRSGTRSK